MVMKMKISLNSLSLHQSSLKSPNLTKTKCTFIISN